MKQNFEGLFREQIKEEETQRESLSIKEQVKKAVDLIFEHSDDKEKELIYILNLLKNAKTK